MKILYINTYHSFGGAAIACNRLFQFTKKNKQFSAKLINLFNKSSDVMDVIGLSDSFITSLLYKVRLYLEVLFHFFLVKEKKNAWNFSSNFRGVSILNKAFFKQAEIVHIHWINHGFISINELEKIVNSGKKIIFTLHDMWLFTGGCHHSRDCQKFTSQCSQCPFLIKISNTDLSTFNFNRKIKALANQNVIIVTCSDWLNKLAKSSKILRNKNIVTIANPIDTTIFFKKIYPQKISTGSYKILFGCANINNPRKGIQYLITALNNLGKEYNSKIEVFIVGKMNDDIQDRITLKTTYLGNISSQERMAEIYNMADLFVLPSLEENLPNMLIEAMACGTPCVAFEIGGIPEIIQHKYNGYLAKYADVEDLKEGIWWNINNPKHTISTNCLNYFHEHFETEKLLKKYYDLYTNINPLSLPSPLNT